MAEVACEVAGVQVVGPGTGQIKKKKKKKKKKKQDGLLITLNEKEIKDLKDLHMPKVGQMPPEVLMTMKSDVSRDAQSRIRAHELSRPREPAPPPQASALAASSRNTITGPSDTYLEPQFQITLEQVSRATMDEIGRASARTPGGIVPSQNQ